MALATDMHYATEQAYLIPAHVRGAEFLAGSHFKVSNDVRVTRDCQKSVFAKDYVPWDVSKPHSITPPAPSDFIGTDFRHFRENIPESKRAYQQKTATRQDTSSYHDRLTASNFSVGGDNRLSSYATTHNLDYPMKEVPRMIKESSKRVPTQSFIPQGDPEKASDPISDYKDRFRAHDITSAVKVNPPKFNSAPAMRGDNRQHGFDTTHNDTYKPWQLPRIKVNAQQNSSNIPQGDRDKNLSLATTFQVSYPAHDVLKPDLASATAQLQRTNIKQDDGYGTWQDYSSTMNDSYKPVYVPVMRSDKQNNVSCLPVGDDDPHRNAFRACMTTHKYDYVKQPLDKPKLVSGANKDTASQVVFGDPQQGGWFFETTHNATFKPQDQPKREKIMGDSYKSNVPVDYYKGTQDDTTTYRSNFLKHNQARLNLNPLAIARMRESHIKTNADGCHEYSTEYTDQYLEKMRLMNGLGFDKDRLQKSSVPLGTMNS